MIFALLFGGELYGIVGRARGAADRGGAARDGRLPAPSTWCSSRGGRRARWRWRGRGRARAGSHVPDCGTRAAPGDAFCRRCGASCTRAPAGAVGRRVTAARGDRGRGVIEALRRARGAARRQLRGARRARSSRSSAPTAPARRRCCRSSPASSAPTRGTVEPRRRARSAGSRSSRPSTRKLSVAENLRLFARLERVADPEAAVARMLEQTGLADRAGDELGHAVGRQPPAGEHRRRPARRSARAAARRAVVVAGPAPARAAVGVHRRPRRGAGTAVVFSTHDVGEAERYADRCSCSPTASCCSRARRPSSRTAVGERHRDFEAAFVRFLHERGH